MSENEASDFHNKTLTVVCSLNMSESNLISRYKETLAIVWVLNIPKKKVSCHNTIVTIVCCLNMPESN